MISVEYNFPILKEYYHEKNTIKLSEISQYAEIDIWWICKKQKKCDCDHSFKLWCFQKIKAKEDYCPYCDHKEIMLIIMI